MRRPGTCHARGRRGRRCRPQEIRSGGSERMRLTGRPISGIRCPTDRARRHASAATSGSRGARKKRPGRGSAISAARAHRGPRGAMETRYPIDPGHRGTTAGPQFGAWMDCRGNAARFKPYDRPIPGTPDVLPPPDCRLEIERMPAGLVRLVRLEPAFRDHRRGAGGRTVAQAKSPTPSLSVPALTLTTRAR
jgi:hypothetical protein